MIKAMYVYILKCSDNSFYTGVTNDLERRLVEHDTGINPSCYTFSRRPCKLVYSELFHNPTNAIAFEKQIKGWSRAKKNALINNDFDTLVKISNSKNNKTEV